MYAPRGRHSECAQACEIAPLYRRGVEDAAPDIPKHRQVSAGVKAFPPGEALGAAALCFLHIFFLTKQ